MESTTTAAAFNCYDPYKPSTEQPTVAVWSPREIREGPDASRSNCGRTSRRKAKPNLNSRPLFSRF